MFGCVATTGGSKFTLIILNSMGDNGSIFFKPFFVRQYLPTPLLTLMAIVPPHTKLLIKKDHLNFVISLFKIYLKYHPIYLFSM
jgi:hypothetical protein